MQGLYREVQPLSLKDLTAHGNPFIMKTIRSLRLTGDFSIDNPAK